MPTPVSAPYLRHLNSSDQLVTSYEAVRTGFVALALERNRRATPHVEEARTLKALASQAASALELLTIDGIQPALLTAAGVSDKAASHMLPEHKLEAIQGLIQHFLEPAGATFVEELVFRFLLTRGDTLGGSMRNVGGLFAQRKLTRAIISTLTLSAIPYHWLHKTNNTWIPKTEDDADIEFHARGISWTGGEKTRMLLYNVTVPLVKSNIDLCLLNCSYQDVSQKVKRSSMIKMPDRYLALGELKGGIDPAGADEHWKTAGSALLRIRKAFSERNLFPHTFFVGAAIQKRMAQEIWQQLESGVLSNAANLTDADQIVSLASWLCTL